MGDLARLHTGGYSGNSALVPAMLAGGGNFLRPCLAAQGAAMDDLARLHTGGRFGNGALIPQVVFINRQIQGRCGDVVLYARLAVPVLIHFLIFPKAIGEGEFRILPSEGFPGEGDVLCYIRSDPVGILRHHPEAVGVKGLAHFIHHSLRFCFYRQLRNDATHAHKITRVIFKVQIPLGVGDGTANGILGLGPMWCEQNIAGFYGVGLSTGGIGLRGEIFVVWRSLPRLVPQDPELARGVIVQEIHIDILRIRLIGRGE